MSVLVGARELGWLVPSRSKDEHGWAEGGLTPRGFTNGTVQEQLPGPQPDGDFGMWEPGQARRGVAYTDDQVTPGDVLVDDGVLWRVKDTRLVRDPRGTREGDCWLSQVEQVS